MYSRSLRPAAKLDRTTGRSGHDIDPRWLHEQYQVRQRSLKDIATETGIPVEDLAAAARTAGIPGQPGLRHAARQLGIRHAILASQVRQLEDAAGTTLLRTVPDAIITLTADGEQFARDVTPVLAMLAQRATAHHVTG